MDEGSGDLTFKDERRSVNRFLQFKNIKEILVVASLFAFLNACGRNTQSSGLNPTPALPPNNTSISLPPPTLESCVSNDPNHQCIGLKIVSFQDSSRVSILQQADAQELVRGMNAIWKPCDVSFQLESFLSIDPSDKNLSYSPNWKTESGQVRAAFEEKDTFLIVAVGPWANSTIAVTQMPGTGPHGVLVEKDYARNPLTVGHELGHYQGLLHLRDNTNLMSPYIGPNTAKLSQAQCNLARSTNFSNWPQMLRHP